MELAGQNIIDDNKGNSGELAELEKINQYFVFTLGNDSFGLNIEHVREVNEYGKVFSVPQAPHFIRGIINLRGEVIPVIDLNGRFFDKRSEVTKFTSIVVVEIEDKDEIILIGVMVDAFKEVIDVKENEIDETPSFGLNLENDYVSGVTNLGGEFVILLDVKTVLNIDQLSGADGVEERLKLGLIAKEH